MVQRLRGGVFGQSAVPRRDSCAATTVGGLARRGRTTVVEESAATGWSPASAGTGQVPGGPGEKDTNRRGRGFAHAWAGCSSPQAPPSNFPGAATPAVSARAERCASASTSAVIAVWADHRSSAATSSSPSCQRAAPADLALQGSAVRHRPHIQAGSFRKGSADAGWRLHDADWRFLPPRPALQGETAGGARRLRRAQLLAGRGLKAADGAAPEITAVGRAAAG